MKKLLFCWLVLGTVVITGCQKETSFEQGNKPGHGTLQEESSGDCLPKTVNGVYEATTPLVGATNNITVDVEVTETGTYDIRTDTVNGIYFRGTGTFTQTGMNTVTLRGNGTPFVAGIHNFVVSFDGSNCDVQITTVPSGAGGPAVFTLETTGTSPVNCSGATAAGTYIIGTALNSTNTVTLSVNVTQIGTFTMTSTATNGMTFSKTDVFLATGVQNVTLVGSGTPTGTAGLVTIPITVGATTCNFQVTTVAGAEYMFDCGSAVVNGTFEEGLPLSGASVDIDVTVATGGPYSFSVTTNGMTFSASGTFTPGPTSITLNATGTPTADGTFPVNLPGGVTPCSFDVVVSPGAPPSDLKWSFKENGVTYEGPTTGALAASTGGIHALGVSGTSTAPNGDIAFQISLTSNNPIGVGSYTTTSALPTAVLMVINTVTSQSLYTGMFGNGAFTVNITTYNTTTHVVEGTFSGQVKDASNATKTITEGKFKAELQ